MKKCSYCLCKFKGNSNSQKFCSKDCQIKKQKDRKNKPIKTSNCSQCKELYITNSDRKKYCSENCRKKAKARRIAKPLITKKCKFCEGSFGVEGKSRNSVFCSEECRKQRWRYKLVEKKCPVCLSLFTTDKRITTCSRECSIIYFDTRVQLECIICGVSFKVSKSRTERATPTQCCSEKCYRESRRTGKSANCHCDLCGEGFYKAPSLQKKHKNNFCSHECMGKYYSKQGLFAGENSPTYIGSFDRHKKYYGATWHSQRRKARQRDNFTCQTCGITEKNYGQELSIHHKIPFIAFETSEEANELKNLISLCEPCHRIEHSGENHPTKYKDKYNI
ncbi:HNH endonuclease [Peribacillus frigoritolerans]|uniref:HNH endonuclease n=1 Tax=Peribacillus frigoritolerans TaxID=450367 RepID=UPI00387229B3